MSKLSQAVRRFRGRMRGESGPVGPRLQEAMQRLHDVLRETPFADRYWVNGGILLGYVRNGGPLPHDDDADFSFWREDKPLLLDAIPALLDAGFRKWRRWTNNQQEPTEWSLTYRGIALEFFEMHRHEDQMRWYCYGGKPTMELLNTAPAHGLQTCRMLDREWQIPAEPQRYLEALYGDWRVPDPDYNYVTDSQAIVRRRPWKGSSRW